MTKFDVIDAAGPRHSLRAPVGPHPWSVIPSQHPRRRPRRVLRRAGAFLLEWGIRVFESSPWEAS